MNITLYFKYTKKQLAEAIRFNILPVPWAKYLLAFASILIFSATILYWAKPISINPAFDANIAFVKLFLLILSIIWGLTLSFVMLIYCFIPAYIFKRDPGVQGNFKLILDNDCLFYEQETTLSTNEKSLKTASIPWHSFIKKAENDEFIILFQDRVKRYILPKSAFQNKSELEEFRIFLNNQSNIKIKTFNRIKLWND